MSIPRHTHINGSEQRAQNRLTRVCAIDFFTKVQKPFDEERHPFQQMVLKQLDVHLQQR